MSEYEKRLIRLIIKLQGNPDAKNTLSAAVKLLKMECKNLD